MAKQLSPQQLQFLEEQSRRWRAAPHGGKDEVVVEIAAYFGKSPKTVRKWLKDVLSHGRDSKRIDAGTTKAKDEELIAISAVLYASFRKNGKRIISVGNAVDMLMANEKVTTVLSESRWNALLRVKGLHPDQINRPEPAIEQRSLHPNHVWQVDASVCVAFFLSNAQGLCVMDEKKFYKNKPDNLTRIQHERLIRYVVVDHYTHAIWVWYCLGSESAAHLAECLILAMSDKGAAHVMHGVPFILQMDMGSANTSAPVRNMLERMQVKVIVHKRHNSRANGSVEKAHDIVETQFESALRFAHIKDLADLTAKGQAWSNHRNATKNHTRYGKPPNDLYMSAMKPEFMRLAPPASVMREMVTTQPSTRVVSSNLEIRFSIKGHGPNTYDVRFVPGVMGGETVEVVLNPMDQPNVLVGYDDPETGARGWMSVKPIARGADGRNEDAPVIGAQVRAAPRGRLEDNRDAVMYAAYGSKDVKTATQAAQAKEAGVLPFGGALDPFRRVSEAKLAHPMPLRGHDHDVADHQPVSAAPMSHEAAAFAIRDVVGQAYPKATMLATLRSDFPGGVPPDRLPEICERVLKEAGAAPSQGPDVVRRAVGDWR